MASVWRGYDETLARYVAVKVLHEHLATDDAFRQRFRREAVSAARLTHPNIVGLYDTGWAGDQVWLVMELVEGPTLKDALAEHGWLEPAWATTIGERVARALDYAHQNGIVHRDVKPGNILLGEDETVKVADFGIAKVQGSDEITRTGTMLGTAAYVSPEQLRGRYLDGTSDQYSLACVLYEALTGRQPFEGDSAVATATQRLEVDPAAPASLRDDLPPGLDDVVLRALALEPEDRYPSAAALAEALAPYTHDGGSSAPAVSMAPRPPTRSPGTPRPTGDAPQPGPSGPAQEPQPAAPAAAAGAGDPWSANGRGGSAPESPPVSATEQRGWAADREDSNGGDADPAPAGGLRAAIRGDVRWLAVGLGLVLAAAGLLGLLVAFAVDVENLVPSTGNAPPEESAAEASNAIVPADISLFDPQGGSSESPADLPNLLDGDPSTRWSTVGYNNASFGNLKSGVGYWMDLGEVHELDLVALRSTTPGVAVDVRVADQPASTPEGWRRVAGGETREGLTELSLDDIDARYVLIWVTGQLQPDGSGRYRAEFSETAVVGKPA